MECLKNWDACCLVAIEQERALGIKAEKCSHTIRNWYQEFRKERNIKVKIIPGKHNMPPFLQQNQTSQSQSNNTYASTYMDFL
jgi:hypothetical protein